MQICARGSQQQQRKQRKHQRPPEPAAAGGTDGDRVKQSKSTSERRSTLFVRQRCCDDSGASPRQLTFACPCAIAVGTDAFTTCDRGSPESRNLNTVQQRDVCGDEKRVQIDVIEVQRQLHRQGEEEQCKLT